MVYIILERGVEGGERGGGREGGGREADRQAGRQGRQAGGRNQHIMVVVLTVSYLPVYKRVREGGRDGRRPP